MFLTILELNCKYERRGIKNITFFDPKLLLFFIKISSNKIFYYFIKFVLGKKS